MAADLTQERRTGRERRAGSLRLTARERDVLELVLRGAQNKEIARQLGVAQQTVKEHVSELLRKFDVPNRAALAEAGVRIDLVGDAIERGWIPQLFRGASARIAVTRGPEHRYVFANDSFAKTFGRDVMGKTMREAFPEHSDAIVVAVDRVFETGESMVLHEAESVEDRGRGRELRYTDAMLQALRGDNGQIEGVAFFAMDVTTQVRARKRA